MPELPSVKLLKLEYETQHAKENYPAATDGAATVLNLMLPMKGAGKLEPLAGLGKLGEEANAAKTAAQAATSTAKVEQSAPAATVAEATATAATSPKAITTKTLEHVFHGEINGKGKATGFHYEGAQMEAPYGTKVIESTRTPVDANGVYTAKVEVQGVTKKATSSFFPRDWSKADVVQAINEAYANRTPAGKSANYFQGTSKSGIKIGMFLNPDGTIATAYPLYNK